VFPHHIGFKGTQYPMKKPVPKAPAESVALYEAVVATIPEVERKGATMPYTSLNGNMFSLLTADGTLALRLPSPEREAFLKRYNTTLSEQYGVVMKEYVSVPASLLKNTSALAKYFEMSYRYACTLKPKPTTKKKPGKQSKSAKRAK
jgi:TfoX/Sxy family transcriptional regulator of competence genes